MHMIYANKESSNNIDVEKISMTNELEGIDETMKEVLSPMRQDVQENHGMRINDSMFRMRTRDKYHVVDHAPWQVFDQYEMFICPINIKLTREFYKNVKEFIFETP